MTRKSHRRSVFATLAATTVATALALAGCSSSGSGQTSSPGGLTTLKVATIGLTSDGGLLTGIKQGFFKQEGLNIQTSIVANPPAGLAAAQSGQVDIAYSPSIPLLNALSQGIKLKIVGAADGYVQGAYKDADPQKIDDTGLYVSAKSGVTKVSQLAGKTIAVPARKAQMEVTIADVLTEAGVKPSSIKWVVLDFTSAVAALKSGTVTAAGLVSPFTAEAAADGSKLVSSPGVAFFEQGAVGLWTTGDNTATGKAKAIAEFQRALAKTNAYANAHPKEAVQAGLTYTKSSLTVDQAIVPYWPAKVTEADIQRVNDKLVKLGFLSKPVDLSGVILPEP